MNNYKINCVGMSDEQKRLVQDAFFKLGAKWPVTLGYQKSAFNYLFSTENELLYASTRTMFDTEPNQEITLNELLKLANMEEYMTFTKADLKTGMVVKYRGGHDQSDKENGLRLVITDTLILSDEFNQLYNYGDDLKHSHHNELDIMEVYEVIGNVSSLQKITTWQLKSIWKRPEQTTQQKAILELEAKQQELIEAAKAIAVDIAKLKGE